MNAFSLFKAKSNCPLTQSLLVLWGTAAMFEQLTQGQDYSRCLFNGVRRSDAPEYPVSSLCVQFLKSWGYCWCPVILKVEVGENGDRIRT